jgi:hypothetical protein
MEPAERLLTLAQIVAKTDGFGGFDAYVPPRWGSNNSGGA